MHAWVRMWVRPDQEERYRAAKALGPGEGMRDSVLTTLQIEIDGLGTQEDWWEDVRVT